MRVAALVGAADDHIHVLPRDVGKILIEIEIVADQKAEADALDLDHGRLGKGKGVVAFQLHLGDLAGGEVLFLVGSRDIAVPVKGIGGVAESLFALAAGVEEHQRMAALCGFRRALQQNVPVFFRALLCLLLCFRKRRAVAGFGHDDDVHGFVAFPQIAQLCGKQGVGLAVVGGIGRLDDADLHKNSPFVNF